MEQSNPRHPGVVLKEDYMSKYDLTVEDVAVLARIAFPLLGRFLDGDFSLSYRIASRLGKVFGTAPEYWMNLQWEYDKWSLENNPNYMAQFNEIMTVERYLEIKGGKNESN